MNMSTKCMYVVCEWIHITHDRRKEECLEERVPLQPLKDTIKPLLCNVVTVNGYIIY